MNKPKSVNAKELSGHAQPERDAYLKVKAASDFIGVPVATLNNKRCAGTGPVFQKIGASVYYKKSALVAWMEAQTCTKTGEIGTH